MTTSLAGAVLGISVSGTLLFVPAAPAAAVRGSVPPLDTAALRAALACLHRPPVTSAQVRIGGAGGQYYGTSGVADTFTGDQVAADGVFRIGGITEVFVATVVLQLVAEHRVSLATPIQRYLPDVLPSAVPPITVAQLLNHTSGLPGEAGAPETGDPETVVAGRYDQWTPEELVALATCSPMKYEPGAVQEHRGVNYVLAAMLIEAVTGRAYGDEIRIRILSPAGLDHTSVAGDETGLYGPHVHAYLDVPGDGLVDVTEFDQTAAWGTGEMASTTDDLQRFVTALFSGSLLPPDMLRKMSTVPPSEVRMADGGPARYGMGLEKLTVNGVTLWGRTGERPGYSAGMFTTADQARRIVYSSTPTRLDASRTERSLRILHAATQAP
jgi:D-alanyl-D-alanine carboxypeptidase